MRTDFESLKTEDVNKSFFEKYYLVDVMFWMLMFLVNVQNIFLLFGIETVYKPYRIISLLLIPIAAHALLKHRKQTARYDTLAITALAYCVFVTAFFNGLDVVQSLPLIILNLSFFMSSYVVSSASSLTIGCYAYISGFFASVLFGTLIHVTGFRFSGLFSNPNYIGYAASICVLMILNPIIQLPKFSRPFLFILSIASVFFSGSRGGILAIAAAMGVQTVSNPRVLRTIFAVLLLFAVANILFTTKIDRMLQSYSLVLYRFSTSEIDRGGSGRIAIAKAALSVGAKTYFTGIGIDQFRKKYYTQFFQYVEVDGTLRRLGTHNFYASLLTEWGMLSALCITTMFFRLFKDASQVPSSTGVIRGIIAAILIMGLSGNVENSPHFWLMLGYCVQLFRFGEPDSLISSEIVTRSHDVQHPVACGALPKNRQHSMTLK